MSVEQTNQSLGVAEGVIRELQDQLQRVLAAHQAAHEALQSIHQEMNLLHGQIETRSRIRLVEPKSWMPDQFGKNRPESENLVVFRKGLRWCGAHSSKICDEECRKPETADLRITSPTRLWRDERDESRVATLLDLKD